MKAHFLLLLENDFLRGIRSNAVCYARIALIQVITLPTAGRQTWQLLRSFESEHLSERKPLYCSIVANGYNRVCTNIRVFCASCPIPRLHNISISCSLQQETNEDQTIFLYSGEDKRQEPDELRFLRHTGGGMNSVKLGLGLAVNPPPACPIRQNWVCEGKFDVYLPEEKGSLQTCSGSHSHRFHAWNVNSLMADLAPKWAPNCYIPPKIGTAKRHPKPTINQVWTHQENSLKKRWSPRKHPAQTEEACSIGAFLRFWICIAATAFLEY